MWFFFPYFIDGDIRAQRNSDTGPGSHTDTVEQQFASETSDYHDSPVLTSAYHQEKLERQTRERL